MSKTRKPRSIRPGNKALREEKELIKLTEENKTLRTENAQLKKALAALNGDKPAKTTKKAPKVKPLSVEEQKEATRAKFAAWNASRKKDE